MSTSAKDQVHSKFKLFAGKLGANGSLGSLATDVEKFAASVKAAPKSIGVEYLEHSKEVIVSLGYRDDEPGYPIKLTSVSLDKVENFSPAECAKLEAKMGEVAAKTPNIICHELLVTDENEFVMVLMTQTS